MDVSVGIKCGKCKREIHMHSCPKHNWTIFSECQNCGKICIVSEKCKECEFPFNKTWDGQNWIRPGK